MNIHLEFLSRKIFTMPQFLAIRYDNRIKSILAVFWIVLFIFVNLTSILYLGALSLQTIFNVKLIYGIWGLALFALLYTIGGGLKSIATTDIIQVFFLILGNNFQNFRVQIEKSEKRNTYFNVLGKI